MLMNSATKERLIAADSREEAFLEFLPVSILEGSGGFSVAVVAVVVVVVVVAVVVGFFRA